MAVKFDWARYTKDGILPELNDIWRRIYRAEIGVTKRAFQEVEKKLERQKGQAIGAQLAGQEVAKGITHLVNYVIRNKDNRVVSVANTPEEARLMLESLGVNPKAIKEESFETHRETHFHPGFTVYNQVKREKKPDYLTIGKLPNLFALSSPLAITASLTTGLPPETVSRESTLAPPTPVSILSESEGEGEKGGKEEMEEEKGGKEEGKGGKEKIVVEIESPYEWVVDFSSNHGWKVRLVRKSDGELVARGDSYESVKNSFLGKTEIKDKRLPPIPKKVPRLKLDLTPPRESGAEMKHTASSAAKTTTKKGGKKK